MTLTFDNSIPGALKFAKMAHHGQFRNDGRAYIEHLKDAANNLKKLGCTEEAIIACYLHDVVEDTKYKGDDILRFFGKKILEIVEDCSENKALGSWRARKSSQINYFHMRRHRHTESLEVLYADKFDNLEDIWTDVGTGSEMQKINHFKSWNAGYESQKWYFWEMYKLFNAQLPSKFKKSLEQYYKMLIDVFGE